MSEWLSSGAMKLFSLLLVAVAAGAVSCERHEFDGPDGTRQFHEHHKAGDSHADHSNVDRHGSHSNGEHAQPVDKAAH